MRAQDEEGQDDHGDDKDREDDTAEALRDLALGRRSVLAHTDYRGESAVEPAPLGPDWNHANTKQAMPSRKAAMPCLV